VVETPSTEENNVLEAPSIDVTEPVDNEPYTEETPQVQETVKQVFVMPVQGEIIKPYSEKELQYSATFGDMRVHLGIDIACENGTSVSSCSNGKILNIEDNSQLGTTITIDHGNGITAKYAGLNEIKFKVGDTVSAGDIIGEVSTIPTECADQSHFHFEVYKNGHPSSPLETLHIN
jgi:murein DD-endopeptidase MepM/ murein hydrolase activator NlpD